MRYRFLGRSGLLVSEIGLGTNTFGGEHDARSRALGALSQADANAVMKAAVDNGVNLIDTADAYGGGESEIRVGTALRDLGMSRDDVILLTKFFNRTGPGPNAVGASRVHIMNSVERSLRKLGTGHIDLYMLHNYDPHTAMDEMLDALDILVRQGKLRYIGCSNLYAWQVMLGLGVSERRMIARFAAIEGQYSVAERGIERELLSMAENQGLGVVAFGVLGSGLLTGKYAADGSAQGPARGEHTGATDRGRAARAVDALRPIAALHGATPGQVAIAWVLAKKQVSSVLLGARDAVQLQNNLKSLALNLSSEEIATLDAVCPPAPEYPGVIQHRLATTRLPPPAS